MFQSQVNADIAWGIVGELALEGPLNGQPARLASADAANNVVGRAFTWAGAANTADTDLGAVQAGGAAGVFAGILANPKVYANRGTTAGGTLAANTTLANGEIGEFVQNTPGIWVELTSAANVGDSVVYADATGILSAAAPGVTPGAGLSLVPGATVQRYKKLNAAAGLALIAINGPIPAVPGA